MTKYPGSKNGIFTWVMFMGLAAGIAPVCAAGSGASHDSPPPAGRYEIDSAHAYLHYRVNHLGFSRIVGRFNSFRGVLTIDPADPGSSSVEIDIDVSSVDTNSSGLDGFLRSERFFDVKKFPSAHFKSKKVAITGEKTALVTGELSLHGIKRPARLHVNFNGHGENPFERTYVLGFSARANLQRSDWDLGAFTPDVGDDVELSIEAEFAKANAN